MTVPQLTVASDDPIDLGVDRRIDLRVSVPQRRDRDPVGEVQVGLAARFVQAVSFAATPFPLEIAAKDRRQVRGGVHRPSVAAVTARD